MYRHAIFSILTTWKSVGQEYSTQNFLSATCTVDATFSPMKSPMITRQAETKTNRLTLLGCYFLQLFSCRYTPLSATVSVAGKQLVSILSAIPVQPSNRFTCPRPAKREHEFEGPDARKRWTSTTQRQSNRRIGGVRAIAVTRKSPKTRVHALLSAAIESQLATVRDQLITSRGNAASSWRSTSCRSSDPLINPRGCTRRLITRCFERPLGNSFIRRSTAARVIIVAPRKFVASGLGGGTFRRSIGMIFVARAKLELCVTRAMYPGRKGALN